MKHYIIVKYNENVKDKDVLHQEVAKLFEGAKQIAGVRCVDIFRSVTNFPNRYDLMILLNMEEDMLVNFDQSEVHHIWKRDYAQYIASKAIFDCN